MRATERIAVQTDELKADRDAQADELKAKRKSVAELVAENKNKQQALLDVVRILKKGLK